MLRTGLGLSEWGRSTEDLWLAGRIGDMLGCGIGRGGEELSVYDTLVDGVGRAFAELAAIERPGHEENAPDRPFAERASGAAELRALPRLLRGGGGAWYAHSPPVASASALPASSAGSPVPASAGAGSLASSSSY